MTSLTGLPLFALFIAALVFAIVAICEVGLFTFLGLQWAVRRGVALSAAHRHPELSRLDLADGLDSRRS